MYCKVRPDVFLKVCWRVFIGFDLPAKSQYASLNHNLLSFKSNPRMLFSEKMSLFQVV